MIDAVKIKMSVQENKRKYTLKSSESITPGGGTKDYEKLKNKPSIENVELVGNKNFEDLGLVPLTNLEIDALLR